MVEVILFDVDGVLLSEERYFDASALTVWEIMYSENYLGLDHGKHKVAIQDDEVDYIRSIVFQNDDILSFYKSCGLNANWDMIYLSVAYQLIRILEHIKLTHSSEIETWLTNEINRDVLLQIAKSLKETEISLDFTTLIDDFSSAEKDKAGLFHRLNEIAKERLDVDHSILGEKGEFWDLCEHVSQEWYVGDDFVLESTGRPSVQRGKTGFLSQEKTICSKEEIEQLFQELTAKGIRIGIGTGRPKLETIEPFKFLNWMPYFEKENIVTADDVLNAERSKNDGKALSKPHPYTYIHGFYHKQKSVDECLQESLPLKNGKELWIVGDSLADLLAAQAIGATFVAVLTGLTGQEARAEFEEYKADYILDDVLQLKEIL